MSDKISEINPKCGGYHLLTYGCQMNVRDSEIIAALLESMGYVPSELETADLIVFNTCSVRHSAENKVFGKIGAVQGLKKNNPRLIIALGGCMAQLQATIERLKRQDVDLVFGTHNLHELPQLINRVKAGERPLIEVWPEHHGVEETLPDNRKNQISAFVNIMYGCDNFCSYCIVPYTRGRERSREAAAIVKEVKHLAKQGFKEITLLGQNVNSYGKGLDEKIDFADLLKIINDIDGIERIRFTTSHPKDLSNHLIDSVASCDKVCENIHVALQSGSNNILKQMNRGYTREYYLEMVDRIRERIPDVSIGTDVIVGFPGETEEDFQQTLDMLEKVQFDFAYNFVYSLRLGTKAATLPNQIDKQTKSARIMQLNDLQYQISLKKNKKLVGSNQEVLVEGFSKTDSSKLTGRTRTNRIVVFSGEEGLISNLINVKIEAVNTFTLFGE